MSTAGKVLVVLVMLMVPVWILLASGVAQLNSEWGQLLVKTRADVDRLEKDVLKNEQEIQKLKDDIALEQDAQGKHEAVLMAQTADVERAKAEVVAIQAAIKVQLQTLGAALKNAQAVREQRIAEKENETKGKASAEKAVEELKAQNAELTDQLTQLRNEFKAVLESNRAYVDRLLKAPAPRRVTRPAAFAR